MFTLNGFNCDGCVAADFCNAVGVCKPGVGRTFDVFVCSRGNRYAVERVAVGNIDCKVNLTVAC